MTATEALAEAWASIDGQLDLFREDKAGFLGDLCGCYEGYLAEAAEMIQRLKARGFDVVAIEEKASRSTAFTTDESGKL